MGAWTKAKQREATKRWRANNRDRVLAAKRAWRKKNLKKVIAGERAAEGRRRHSKKRKAWRKANGRQQYLKKYGMTVPQYEALLVAQGGVCAVCRRSCKTGRRLAVDHCHATGRIRGLLCSNCNRAAGLLGDDPVRVAAMARYLESPT